MNRRFPIFFFSPLYKIILQRRREKSIAGISISNSITDDNIAICTWDMINSRIRRSQADQYISWRAARATLLRLNYGIAVTAESFKTVECSGRGISPASGATTGQLWSP